MLLAELLAYHLHLRAGRLKREPGLDPSSNQQVVCLVGAIDVGLEGEPYIRQRIRLKICIQNATYHIRLTIKGNGAADQPRVGAKSLPPELVADDDNVQSSSPILFRSKAAPDCRL